MVCLGNINPGQLSVGFVLSMLECQRKQIFSNYIIHTSGPYLDDGRNNVVRAFLKHTTDDYLLFIDSDITWTTDDVTNLVALANDQCVIGGWYNNPYTQGVWPVCFEWTMDKDLDGEMGWVMRPVSPEHIMDCQENGIYTTQAIGTGFMLIPRLILEKIAARGWSKPCEFFAEPIVNGVHMGEDLAFCLRVWEQGFPVYLATDIKLQHVKKVVL